MANPAITLCASSFGMCLHFFPIIKASSPSKSNISDTLGSCTSSKGPATERDCLLKTIGTSGSSISLPAALTSSRWSA